MMHVERQAEPGATGSDWIKSSLTYQIYPLSFNYAKGSESDPYEGRYGNLKGITEKADYVKSLGVDAVWICPMYESPLQTGFGYNVTDYKSIGKPFGTMDDMDELIAAYHQRGIKVIIDQVYSHTDMEHEWFKASRDPSHTDHEKYKDYYVWYPANESQTLQYDESGNPVPPNNWGSIMSKVDSAWEWDDTRKAFYLHSFDQRMPDLNINNPVVQDEILGNAKFWLDKGVDGFRLDAVCHYGNDPELRSNPLEGDDEAAPSRKLDEKAGGQRKLYDVNQPAGRQLLEKLNNLVKTHEFRQIGDRVNKTQPYQPALLSEFNFDKGHDANKKGEELVKEGPCDTFFTGAFLNGPDQGRGLKSFKKDINEMLALSPDGSRINWAMSNHDMARVLTRWFGDDHSPEHAKLCNSLMLSLPGSVCIYQGEELGLDNPPLSEVKRSGEDLLKHDPLKLTIDACFPWDAARTPMPWTGNETEMWLKMPASHAAKTVAQQENDRESVLSHTRRAIALRRATPALSDPGNLTFIETGNENVVAFVRTSKLTQRQIVCAFNFSSEKAEIALPAGMHPLIGGEGNGTITVEPLKERFVEVMSPAQSLEAGLLRNASVSLSAR